MIQTRSNLSSAALDAAGGRSNYFASHAHYEAIAHRIVAVLRGGSRHFVLVTGDPPANPQVLSEALGNVAGSGYAVIIVPCGPELRHEDLERPVPILAERRATRSAAAEAGGLVPASPLFVFDDCDRLSDRQIEEVCKSTLCHDRMQGTAVLLAPRDFIIRLERPALHFLRERIAAELRFQEVSDGEAIAALHNQLLSQRDRRAEARGFRHGVLVGLAAGGVILAASLGAFILHPTAEQVGEAPASTRQSSSVSEKVSMPGPIEEAAASVTRPQAALNAETAAVIATPPPLAAPPSPPSKAEYTPPVAVSSVAQSQAGLRLSATEITALLARGDAFLSAGDITSARAFYERAADAESGLAALQLGATFDALFTGRLGFRAGTADPAQALFWYRRARELGAGEAERRIKALDSIPVR